PPAWPSFPEPQAVQASAAAPASSDSAPVLAPEPAPSVEEVASTVPGLGVSLESRMAELFAELSAAEIPSSAEMPTEEYAAPVETNAAAVEEQAGAELIGCSGGHVDPTGRSCWHDPSAVCFCQCHASQAAAPAEVETPAPATTRPFWAKPSANKVLPPSGGR